MASGRTWLAALAVLGTTHCSMVTGLGDYSVVETDAGAADAGATPPPAVSSGANDASAPKPKPAPSTPPPPTPTATTTTTSTPPSPPLPTTLPRNVADGTFETNVAAAFDGTMAQAAADSARTPAKKEPGNGNGPVLFREFDCEAALRRLEVHAPAGSFFLFDATSYPAGGTGKMILVGRRATSSAWQELATKPFGTTSPVIFDASVIPTSTAYVAYGVRFTSDQPAVVGTFQVAEIGISAECSSPPAQIAWSTTAFACGGVECVTVNNTGGTLQRSVSCARSTGGTAHERLCEGAKPATTGGSCALSCSYALSYVGARAFTYDNNSGWLHEGSMTSRAGPLPSTVDFGTTRAAIEGKPCSIKTTNAATYFVGIQCDEPNSLYCAFRCE